MLEGHHLLMPYSRRGVLLSCIGRRLKDYFGVVEPCAREGQKLIVASWLFNSIDALEQRRNVGCFSLFYHYYNSLCWNDITELVPNTRPLLRSTLCIAYVEIFRVIFISGKSKSNFSLYYYRYPNILVLTQCIGFSKTGVLWCGYVFISWTARGGNLKFSHYN